MQFQIQHKETFTNQLRDVPVQFWPQILDKAETLRSEPRPDGHMRKKLKKYHGNICRIRSGDYRIIYTYGDGWVELLGVDGRDDVYDEQAYVGSGLGRLGQSSGLHDRAFVIDEKLPVQERDDLPGLIDENLLQRLSIPDAYFPALTPCRTVQDLLDADVPDVVRNRLFDVVTDPDFDSVLTRPSYHTGEIHNLLRYVEGDLMGFLLKLDTEQEAMVDWGMKGSGPTLLKGGPGTGKSTVALYRVQALLRDLQRQGVENPRILFTTYTNALVTFSQQLLHSLLGEDMRYIEVHTADAVVQGIVNSFGFRQQVVPSRELFPLLHKAAAQTAQRSAEPGTGLLREAPELTDGYILEEIGTVIEAHALTSLDAYLRIDRTGRRVRLTARQRTAIWTVYEQLIVLMDNARVSTWHRLRRRAMAVLRAGRGPRKYDAVIIDEAQDLEPTTLRVLVEMCAHPNRLFITADANQSIYGSTFRWANVHENLRVRGRTSALRTNYRSTRQIGQAAREYLAYGPLEPDIEQLYASEGPLPLLARADSPMEEVAILAEFMRSAAYYCRLGLDSCAVLVPSEAVGKDVAGRLRQVGIAAEYMTGRDLDLTKRVVKVITLHAAKGLEFPIVSLTGITRGFHQPEGTGGEREEEILKMRRTIFVGMTRAMRALAITAPHASRNPLLQGLGSTLWHMQEGIHQPAHA